MTKMAYLPASARLHAIVGADDDGFLRRGPASISVCWPCSRRRSPPGWYFESALIDAHSWRQITNADIARHFMTTLDLLHPQVSWGGRDGIVGMEFPLLQWLTGVMWRVTGESHVVARLVALLFSVGGVACLYGLGARLLGRPAGLAAAALMAVAPSTVFFGRTFLSDTPMLTFMIAAVWAWDVYFERAGRGRLAVAAALTALAAFVKLPAILVLAPIVGTAAAPPSSAHLPIAARGWADSPRSPSWPRGTGTPTGSISRPG
jgi:predicted membrane-bound mannosyltransferase